MAAPPPLPFDQASWNSYYRTLSPVQKSLEGVKSGSKLSWEHAICLRVQHTTFPAKQLRKKLLEYKDENMDDSEDEDEDEDHGQDQDQDQADQHAIADESKSTSTRTTANHPALDQRQLLTAPRQSRQHDAERYLADGCFGVFFSLLDEIVRLPTVAAQMETGISFTPTPVAKRTRSRLQAQLQQVQGQDDTPTRPKVNRLRNKFLALRLRASVVGAGSKREKKEEEEEEEDDADSEEEDVQEDDEDDEDVEDVEDDEEDNDKDLDDLENNALRTPPGHHTRQQEATPSTAESVYAPEAGNASEAIAEDESIVNSCILALLIPLTWSEKVVRNVSAVRKPFIFNAGNDIRFTACVDGLILSPTDPATMIGFIEAKRGIRGQIVRIQEAAEAVAFVSHSTTSSVASSANKEKWKFSSTNGLFILSICSYKIFITVTTWPPSYRDFLSRSYVNNNEHFNMSDILDESMLTMREYGPFDLQCSVSRGSLFDCLRVLFLASDLDRLFKNFCVV
ncbi:hypothetical protein WAI453_013586 [Rhynchosporium graminicola]